MLRKAVLALSLALGFCSVTFPLAAESQQVGKVYRIGVLYGSTAAPDADMEAFRQALRELGWANERAITFEERSADGHYERLPRLAAELVALKIDLIFAAGGTPTIEAAMKATRTIPIVFPGVSNPVDQKMVQSFAHPGGNVTGLSLMGSEMYGKRLELLGETVPGIKRVALIVNGANSSTAEVLRWSRTISQSLGIRLEAFDVRNPEDFEKTFDKMSRVGVQALIVHGDGMLNHNLKQLGGLALKHQLPMIAEGSATGVLLSYSADTGLMYRRAATYVDKIFKGAKPGDLPIEQATKFELIINLKTANALGLTIPQSLLLRADEVIQ